MQQANITREIEASRPRMARSRRIVLSAIAVAACAGLVVPVATAAQGPPSSPAASQQSASAAACPERMLVSPFAPWDDANLYFLLSNGGFENGSSSWTLGPGASIVPENESFYLGSPADGSSLRLDAGGRAVSSAHCLQVGDRTLRFMVKGRGVPGAQLTIDAHVETEGAGSGIDLRAVVTQTGDRSTDWAPSAAVVFPLGRSQLLADTATVTFTFTASGGPWQIDDVYVDPFRSR